VNFLGYNAFVAQIMALMASQEAFNVIAHPLGIPLLTSINIP